MSSLSSTKQKGLDIEEGSGILVEILADVPDIQYAYTHHPALLYWVFSSERIPSDLQYVVVSR